MCLCQGFINLTQLNTAQLSARCCLLLQPSQIPLFPDLAPNHVVLPVLQFWLEQDYYWIFTISQRSCGKVMFSVMFLSVQYDRYSWRNRLVPSPLHGATGIGSPWLQFSLLLISRTALDIRHVPLPHVALFSLALPPATDIWWPSLETFSNLFTWGLVLTSGSHWSTYSWQAGGTHPTGLLSCTMFFSVVYKSRFSLIHSSTDLNSNFH